MGKTVQNHIVAIVDITTSPLMLGAGEIEHALTKFIESNRTLMCRVYDFKVQAFEREEVIETATVGQVESPTVQG